jgi:hypothetical protein
MRPRGRQGDFTGPRLRGITGASQPGLESPLAPFRSRHRRKRRNGTGANPANYGFIPQHPQKRNLVIHHAPVIRYLKKFDSTCCNCKHSQQPGLTAGLCFLSTKRYRCQLQRGRMGRNARDRSALNAAGCQLSPPAERISGIRPT